VNDRYRPVQLRNGPVIQSGLSAQNRYRRDTSLLDPTKRPFRALVVNSRVVGEEGQVRNLSVECDVLLVRTQILIQNVPVAQKQHGVNNVHDLWVPRPTTRHLDDGELNLDRQLSRRGTANPVPPTPLDQCDGDMVLLDFIEGDIAWPIITHALTHERSNRILRAGVGWREGSVEERGNPRRDEFYVHHYGCEVRVNEQGELLIDTVGAYDDPATEDASSTSIGQVRVRVKEGQRFTIAIGDDEDVFEVFKDGAQLRIDLGEAADQRLVLGDDQVSALKAFVGNGTALGGGLSGWAELVKAGITAGGGTLDNTTFYADIITLRNALDAALSDLAKTKKT
jgi:hypothetical protein